MPTTVINKYHAPDGWQRNNEYVYIGRGSVFGNPVVIGKVCPICGETHKIGGSTLLCYRQYFDMRLSNEIGFIEKVRELRGKKLVCFCKPKPCHGDIIAEWVDEDAQIPLTFLL